MTQLSGITLFCEDIREETILHSLIGVIPDNIAINSIPGAFPKLCIYTRITTDTDYLVGDIDLLLKFSDGQEMSLGSLGETIRQAKVDSKVAGNPITTIIQKAVASPFPFLKEGRILAVIRYNDQELISGTLNVTLIDPSNAPTASPQQSWQFPPAAPAS